MLNISFAHSGESSSEANVSVSRNVVSGTFTPYSHPGLSREKDIQQSVTGTE